MVPIRMQAAGAAIFDLSRCDIGRIKKLLRSFVIRNVSIIAALELLFSSAGQTNSASFITGV